MVIIGIQGGLGNQLQQYALYRKFISMGVEARIDLSWFDADNQANMAAKRTMELKHFPGVKYQVCTKQERDRLTGGNGFTGKIKRKLSVISGVTTVKIYKESSMYDENLLNLRNAYLEGYFANEYYYKDILDELKNEFVFPIDKSKNKERLLKYASIMQVENSVSVHLRRGDYLDEINRTIFGGICTGEYYSSAVRYVAKNVINPRFYIFSDDISYALDYANKLIDRGFETEVVDINYGDESFYDIYLMSKCKHHITANSTFSFWGARLSDAKGIKIRPSKQKTSQIFCEEMYTWWKGWTFISPSGEVL